MFANARWTMHAGLGGVHWQGITSREIESTLRLLGVPRAEWPALMVAVRMMESAAAPILNERSRTKA